MKVVALLLAQELATQVVASGPMMELLLLLAVPALLTAVIAIGARVVAVVSMVLGWTIAGVMALLLLFHLAVMLLHG